MTNPKAVKTAVEIAREATEHICFLDDEYDETHREQAIINIEKAILSERQAQAELRARIQKASNLIRDIYGLHINCNQCQCAITSDESQCETFKLADEAIKALKSDGFCDE